MAKTGNFKVLEGQTAIAPFLRDVCQAADAHRLALGFFPRSVFEQFASRGYLNVLVEQHGDRLVYVGHLMFQLRFPRASIIQMFTLPERRREGLAGALLDHFRRSLINDGFTSIYARVAEDLNDANAFWERQKFYIQRVEPGGSTKKRHILVRCHELPTPQLFPRSELSSENPLGVASSSSNLLPLYLLDLNVLYDIGPRRFRREEALGLFQAERMNFCRLAVTDEVSRELKRTAQEERTDPMEAYVSLFPILPFQQENSTKNLHSELAEIIFPHKKQLSANDKSDLRHLEISIQNNVTGFITNDSAMLDAANAIRAKYDIDVLSPKSFALDAFAESTGATFSAPEHARISVREVSEDEEKVLRNFLIQLCVPTTELAQGWLPTGAQERLALRYGVWSGRDPVGYITWSSWCGADSVKIRAAIDEKSEVSQYVAHLILTTIMDNLAKSGPRKLSMICPSQQAILRDTAFSIGFRSDNTNGALIKVILGRLITSNSWASVRKELADKCNIKLPKSIPFYRTDTQPVEVITAAGVRSYIALCELETLLSPAILCLPNRPSVITPVQRKFSELLLKCEQQQQLLPEPVSSLFHEKHYMSGPNTIRSFKRGGLILFYESLKNKGRGELIAIARTREVYIKPDTKLTISDFEQSVLSAETIESIGKAEMKTITVFDNVFHLPNAVPLKKLKEFGCGKASDLITTHPITQSQLDSILKEAMNNA